MAAAVPKKPIWWNTKEGPFSSDSSNANQPFSRPSITTGATLPWDGKSSSSLGPPRAFYAGHATIPTITVSSCQPGMTNFVCKGEPAATTIPASPFAVLPEKDCSNERGTVPLLAEIQSKPEESGSEAPAMTHYQQSDESPQDGYAKQASLQSGGTSLESSQPSVQGQIITTAQDEQGLAMTLGQAFAGPKDARKSARHNPFHQAVHHPFPQAATVTTNSSLQPAAELRPSNGPAETEVLPLSFRSLPVDPSFAAEETLGRRRGLRSAPVPSLRHEVYQPEEELQKCDSLGLDARSTDAEAEGCVAEQEEKRRIRRRNNNRESAKRVREKRDADLKAVNGKIAKLQESQAELLERCTTMDGACQRLHRELDQMRSRWENGKVENLRLKTEVEHLRRNMRVGEHQDLGTKMEPREGMRTIGSANFLPTTEEMVADVGGGGWDHKSYDPLTDQYLTFTNLSSALSLDFPTTVLPETFTML